MKRHQELCLTPGTLIMFPKTSVEINISKYFIILKAMIQNCEILPENSCNFTVIALKLKGALYTDMFGSVKGFNVLGERLIVFTFECTLGDGPSIPSLIITLTDQNDQLIPRLLPRPDRWNSIATSVSQVNDACVSY